MLARVALVVSVLLLGCRSPIESPSDGDGGGGGSGARAPVFERAPQSTACARYVACAATVTEDVASQAKAEFGPRAACWSEGDAAAASCDDACRASALAIGCPECAGDADCSGQAGASACVRGACAAPACAFDPAAIAAVRAAALACDAAHGLDDAAFVASLAASTAELACGPAFDAWARCEATSLACADGRVDLYAACTAELGALTACENGPRAAACPA